MNKDFENFRHNVFCRRLCNQHKAMKLWKIINKKINQSDKNLFETEWNHYMLDHLDIDGFSHFFNSYVRKYFN